MASDMVYIYFFFFYIFPENFNILVFEQLVLWSFEPSILHLNDCALTEDKEELISTVFTWGPIPSLSIFLQPSSPLLFIWFSL